MLTTSGSRPRGCEIFRTTLLDLTDIPKSLPRNIYENTTQNLPLSYRHNKRYPVQLLPRNSIETNRNVPSSLHWNWYFIQHTGSRYSIISALFWCFLTPRRQAKVHEDLCHDYARFTLPVVFCPFPWLQNPPYDGRPLEFIPFFYFTRLLVSSVIIHKSLCQVEQFFIRHSHLHWVSSSRINFRLCWISSSKYFAIHPCPNIKRRLSNKFCAWDTCCWCVQRLCTAEYALWTKSKLNCSVF